MKRARVLHDSHACDGVIVGDHSRSTRASRSRRTPRDWPPVEPRQIIATHLTYRSRCVEYRMAALPAYPSYFMKPLGSVSHHRRHGGPPARAAGS